MLKNITLTDLRHAKRLAKAARREDRSQSHQQHLDSIARTVFGVRDYHELQTRQKRTMAAHLVDEGSVCVCSYCGLRFAPDVDSDQREHADIHERYEQAHAALGELPSHYAGREIRKRVAYDQIYSADAETRTSGAEELMRVYFERSLDKAIHNNWWKAHPNFETYARELAPVATFLPADLRVWAAERFGSPQTDIDLTDTYWPYRAS